jgi:predicted  nucleic acid-binding Zn-ribbon protein
MANNEAFLQEFQGNMQRLSQINGIIQKNIQDKKDFSAYIIGKLGSINQSIVDLAGRIKALKDLVDQLQATVNTNSGNIQQKDEEIADLHAQIQKLSADQYALKQQYDTLQKKCRDDLAANQQQISDLNAQIQKLNADNAALQQRVASLEDELRNTGDEGAKNVEELKKQADAFKQVIDKLTAENNNKIDELNQIIQTKTAENAQLTDALQKAQENFQRQTDELNRIKAGTQARELALQQNIDVLTAENVSLIGRLKDANTAIINALTLLDQLTDENLNRENLQNVNVAIQQIEKSLEEINRALQGQPAAPAGAVASSSARGMNRINGSDVVNVIDTEGNEANLLYKDIISKLTERASKVGISPKYGNALREIKATNNVSVIPDILRRNGVDVKNGKIFGGKKYKHFKKTKKCKKSKKSKKGGFSYKINSKRKSLRTKSLPSLNFKRSRTSKFS